jgi:hypothetical protein
LQKEGAWSLGKESPSLFKRGIFPKGMTYAKGEFLDRAEANLEIASPSLIRNDSKCLLFCILF